MKQTTLPLLLSAPLLLVLSACGGGNDITGTASATGADTTVTAEASADERVVASIDESAAEAVDSTSDSTTASPSDSDKATAEGVKPKPPATTPPSTPAPNSTANDSQRIAAATSTAQSATNACSTVRPFYWELGSNGGKLASGSVKSSTSTLVITSTTPMSIASASKWVYGAYVAQKRNGVLTADDIPRLSMRSGYTNFNGCLQNQTVDTCLAYETNGVFDANTNGKFDYGGGHMEKHASLMGLGGMNNKTLAAEIQSQIGSDVKIMYSQPQLAGGIVASADTYALFLRKILGGQLKIGSLLGSNPACTNKATCPAGTAVYAPIPPTESWHYSAAHWVEDDPKVGDGAFSSPGAFGFYPWIDASHTYYGVLARSVPGGAFDSVQCGRLIRKAWTSATPL